MNHELAKQLKDAGFPQEDCQFWYVAPKEGMPVALWYARQLSTVNGETKDWFQIAAPVLSELVEACGDRFEAIVRIHYPEGNIYYQAYPTDDWFDKSDNECVKDCCGYETGSTPEEAVANLWLALNKK